MWQIIQNKEHGYDFYVQRHSSVCEEMPNSLSIPKIASRVGKKLQWREAE